MSYAILRIQKFTAGSVHGIQIHDRREADVSHTNPDIDRSRSDLNFSLHEQSESFHRAIRKRISGLGNMPKTADGRAKKIRKDAIVMAQALVTSDADFFSGMPPEEARGYFEDSLLFIEKKYGRENIISATVHMDEKTPHMHVNFVPVTKDKLCAKELFTPMLLRGLQDEFWASVGVQHGLLRGGDDNTRLRRHMEMTEYKAMKKKVDSMISRENDEVERLQEEKKLLEDDVSALRGEVDILLAERERLSKFEELEEDDFDDYVRKMDAIKYSKIAESLVKEADSPYVEYKSAVVCLKVAASMDEKIKADDLDGMEKCFEKLDFVMMRMVNSILRNANLKITAVRRLRDLLFRPPIEPARLRALVMDSVFSYLGLNPPEKKKHRETER